MLPLLKQNFYFSLLHFAAFISREIFSTYKTLLERKNEYKSDQNIESAANFNHVSRSIRRSTFSVLQKRPA
jgi:hypothetical protein